MKSKAPFLKMTIPLLAAAVLSAPAYAADGKLLPNVGATIR